MPATILDGKWLAAQFQRSIKNEVTSITAKGARAPGLGVILVGENPASKAYVANKSKIATQCGFATFDAKLSSEAAADEVRAAIKSFNDDSRVDGILLQLPLPKHLNSNELLNLINPAKDADGLHPHNQGLLMRGEGELRPCTPVGSMRLLDVALAKVNQSIEIDPQKIPFADLSGKSAVVIGRSILVGKPVALLLLERNATVTMAHSKTKDLPAVCRAADIVVAAVGIPNFVKREWIKQGAVVIDVGINRLPSGSLTGDVDFEGIKEVADSLTPVPGGVGPMTVTMLISNTLAAYKKNVAKN